VYNFCFVFSELFEGLTHLTNYHVGL